MNKKPIKKLVKKKKKGIFEDNSDKEENDISVKTLLIILAIGIIVVIVLLMISNLTQSKPIKINNSLISSSNQTYNSLFVQGYNFGSFSGFRFDGNNQEYFSLDFSNNAYEGEYSLKINVEPSSYDGDYLLIERLLLPVDITKFVYVEFFYKSTDYFEFTLELADEDDWFRYRNIQIVPTNNWTKVVMPIEDFEILKFKSSDEQVFTGIIDYMVWWKRTTRSNSEIEQNIFIDALSFK
ncbi:hypothetical protein ISS09_03695 [Candidatus Woesearchaeota archaeon]|nr:hypothetical protein [Candidatus Woesearchaeota archaeon]